MKNILLISFIAVAIVYMFVILFDKYNSIKAISVKNNKTIQQKTK